MAAFELNQPLIVALQARLEAALPAAIEEVNDRNTDGIELDNVAQVLDFVPQAELLTDFPIIGIQDLPSTFEDDTGFSLTGHHGLGVVIFVAEADQRALAWKLRRYAQAVATVALDTRLLGDGWGTLLGRVVPGPTLDVSETPRTWMSWTMVQITARRSE